MKTRYLAIAIAVAASLLLATPQLHADDKDKKLDKAKNVVNNVRQADPPKESTGTVRSDPREISKRENAKERERQKEVSKKYSPDKIKVPSPTTSNKGKKDTNKKK